MRRLRSIRGRRSPRPGPAAREFYRLAGAGSTPIFRVVTTKNSLSTWSRPLLVGTRWRHAGSLAPPGIPCRRRDRRHARARWCPGRRARSRSPLAGLVTADAPPSGSAAVIPRERQPDLLIDPRGSGRISSSRSPASLLDDSAESTRPSASNRNEDPSPITYHRVGLDSWPRTTTGRSSGYRRGAHGSMRRPGQELGRDLSGRHVADGEADSPWGRVREDRREAGAALSHRGSPSRDPGSTDRA